MPTRNYNIRQSPWSECNAPKHACLCSGERRPLPEIISPCNKAQSATCPVCSRGSSLMLSSITPGSSNHRTIVSARSVCSFPSSLPSPSLPLMQAHPMQRSLYRLYMRRICCSLVYFSRPESRLSHHSNSMELQISLNQGVNFKVGSSKSFFRLSAPTYWVAWTSLGLLSRSTCVLMKRM